MALSLVSYDDSDESDNEREEDVTKVIASEKTNIVSTKETNISKSTNLRDNPSLSDRDDETEEDATNGSSKPTNFDLPGPKVTLLNTDIDIKCLTSKKNGPVKITIPSLNEVDEETEQPLKKKLKPSQKGSGLFALLPSPKSSLVPQSVVNKNRNPPSKVSNTVTSKKIQPAPPTLKSPKIQAASKSSLITYDDSGDEDDNLGTVDFFSLDKKDDEVPASDVIVELPSVSQPSEPNLPVKNTSETSLNFKPDFQPPRWAVAHPSSSNYQPQPADAYHTSDFVSTSTDNLQLDDEAMQQLCGRRDRMKKQELNIIDVSGDAIMPDSREWLTKQLSEEQAHRPSHKKKDGPTSQQKRKHQITYLAFQAKENELELKNQWANNRMTRKQTQSKYGF